MAELPEHIITMKIYFFSIYTIQYLVILIIQSAVDVSNKKIIIIKENPLVEQNAGQKHRHVSKVL